MPLTQPEAEAIKRAVRRLVRAEIDNSWKGGQDPIYHEDIETELRVAKAKLGNLLSVKTEKPRKLRPKGPELVRLQDKS